MTTETPDGLRLKVSIPPRRRTATIEVTLENKRIVKASVTKAAINLTQKVPGVYSNGTSLTLPRNVDDIQHVIDLLNAVIDEVNDQDEFLRTESKAAG